MGAVLQGHRKRWCPSMTFIDALTGDLGADSKFELGSCTRFCFYKNNEAQIFPKLRAS